LEEKRAKARAKLMMSAPSGDDADHNAEFRSTVGTNIGAGGSALADPTAPPPPPQAKDSPRVSTDGSPRLRPQAGYVDHVTGETLSLAGDAGSISPRESVDSQPSPNEAQKAPIMMFVPKPAGE